jgi:hypothetical protein
VRDKWSKVLGYHGFIRTKVFNKNDNLPNDPYSINLFIISTQNIVLLFFLKFIGDLKGILTKRVVKFSF